MTVAVAVSGGVDSLAALLLLRETGPVVAVYGLFHDAAPSLAPRLAALCGSLRVPFRALDLRDIFRDRVVNYFTSYCKAGLTPNPCAMCNREIKFGALLEACGRLGAEKMATGHYARLGGNGAELWRGADGRKDQSYFLSLVPGDVLGRALFPLGDYTKAQTRELVARAGLEPLARRESQDICFLAGGSKGEFLRSLGICRPGPVRLESTGQRLGEHGGLGQYTVGQRQGLGIPWREPLYVRRLDTAANTLWVAPRSEVMMRGCLIRLARGEDWRRCGPLHAQLRYNQKPVPVEVADGGGSLTRLELAWPVLATAPGQVAALYTPAGRVAAAGIVEEVIFTGCPHKGLSNG